MKQIPFTITMTSNFLLALVLILKIGSVEVESAPPAGMENEPAFPPFIACDDGLPTRMRIEPTVAPFSSNSNNNNALLSGTRSRIFDMGHFVRGGGKRKLWVIMVPLVIGLLILLVFATLLVRLIEQPKRDARVFDVEQY